MQRGWSPSGPLERSARRSDFLRARDDLPDDFLMTSSSSTGAPAGRRGAAQRAIARGAPSTWPT